MNREYVCLAVPRVEMDTGLVHTDYLPRQELVRCRDCRHGADSGTECWWFSHRESAWTPERPAHVEPEGFCAWGRRGDGVEVRDDG